MRSKWLRFLLLEQGKKTSAWSVKNKKNESLGVIKWYSQWRQYCFITYYNILQSDSIVYSQSCLRDIAEFIKEQMDKRKK